MEEATTGLHLADLGIIAGLIGALWAAMSHRMGRIEQQLDGLSRTSVTPDMCKAHAKAVNVKIEGVDTRVQQLEARA